MSSTETINDIYFNARCMSPSDGREYMASSIYERLTNKDLNDEEFRAEVASLLALITRQTWG